MAECDCGICRNTVPAFIQDCSCLYVDLKETQEAAQARMEKIESDMAKEQGINEALKAQDQMAWVGAMNMIRHQAEEIVFQELIYN